MWLALASRPSETRAPVDSLASRPTAPANVVSLRSVADRSSSIDAATLRALIYEELAVHAADTKELPAPPTEEQTAAAEEAMAIVDAAVAAGRWTSADDERLRAIGGHLEPEALGDVLLAKARAVNEQKLSIP